MTRRDFFVETAVAGGSLWIVLRGRPAQGLEEPPPFRLDDARRKILGAIVGRILPADDGPGAVEADCVYFIERTLDQEPVGFRETYLSGVSAVETVSRAVFGASFAALEPPRQDELLVALQSGQIDGWPDRAGDPAAFFETVRLHTIQGFLADPSYGGNRDYVGWKLVGYPGPVHRQGGYTARQMSGHEAIKTPWMELLAPRPQDPLDPPRDS